ncbi:MAG: sensor histidine kinase, partial [Brachybacterium tyrofermentans]
MSGDVFQLAGWQLAALLGAALLLGALVGGGAIALGKRRSSTSADGHGATGSGPLEKLSARVLSHEIRTPLTLVKGAADLLAEETPGPLNATQRYFVDTIVGNTSLVVSMAEDFLLEARLETGEPTLDRTAVDIRTLVRETVLELRRIRSTPL